MENEAVCGKIAQKKIAKDEYTVAEFSESLVSSPINFEDKFIEQDEDSSSMLRYLAEYGDESTWTRVVVEEKPEVTFCQFLGFLGRRIKRYSSKGYNSSKKFLGRVFCCSKKEKDCKSSKKKISKLNE